MKIFNDHVDVRMDPKIRAPGMKERSETNLSIPVFRSSHHESLEVYKVVI